MFGHPMRSWPRMRAVSMTTQHSFKILPLLGWLTGALFFLYAWVLRVEIGRAHV